MYIGDYIVDKEIYRIEKIKNIFYQIDSDGKRTKLTKTHIAQIVGNRWDDFYDFPKCEIDNGIFRATRSVPIYDTICLDLYGYGKTEEEARRKVQKLYNEFDNLSEKIENNIKKNKENQMMRIHKFAIIPKNKTLTAYNNIEEYYTNMELVFFKDGKDDFRRLLIDIGIPNDGRADECITGYVEGNNIVFTKMGFTKGEKSYYIDVINTYKKEIAKHYNIENYVLYYESDRYYDILQNSEGIYPEDMDTLKFDYYYPKNPERKIEIEEER